MYDIIYIYVHRYFSCDVGTAAHTRLDIPCALPPSGMQRK